jgi:orotate phosphoribosyltransferase
MKKQIAKELLKLGAVKFQPENPFTYASGLRGPMYCDNRMVLSHVDFRNLIIEGFIQLIKENNLSEELLGGIATAGIPHAAIVADRLNLPMVYVRPKPKGHGKMNQVEGDYKSNQTVLLFEDLVNQGASLEEAITGTLNAQLIVKNCLCIVDYKMKEAKNRLDKLGINLLSLTDFSFLADSALELKLVDTKGREKLLEWHDDPVLWSKRYLENSK